MNVRFRTVALCAGLTVPSLALGQAGSLEVLPYMGGNLRLSGDGRYIFGRLSAVWNNDPRLLRWSHTGGMEFFGHPIFVVGGPRAVSVDGTAAVGFGYFGGTLKGFHWSEGGGFVIASGSPLQYFSSGYSCSADGQWAAGYTYSTGTQNPDVHRLYRWSAASGYQVIGPPPGIDFPVQPHAMSADGSIIAGTWSRIFLWRQDTGMTVLIPPGTGYGQTHAMSAEGGVLGGFYYGTQSNEYFTFRWTARHGFVPIHTESLVVMRMSADGWRLAWGRSPFPMLWDPVNGARTLDGILASHGISPFEGWTSISLRDMSNAGDVLIGTGSFQGVPSVWRVTIPPFCYANCDGSTTSPALNVADFSCFLQKFVADDIYANCNNDAHLNIADFSCFLQKFAQGCP